MAHQADNNPTARIEGRTRRRHPARWTALFVMALVAGVVAPLGIAAPQASAVDGASDGLICKANPGGTPADPTSSFVLTAHDGYIMTPDRNSIYMWSYSAGNDAFQYPGVTLCVTQGDVVTITLKNRLPVATSIVFPGITGVQADGALAVPDTAVPDSLTKAALPNSSVTYTFTADHEGTFLYESGTNAQLQSQMGLHGTLVVRPKGFDPNAPHTYNKTDGTPDTATSYKAGKEYLNFFSEVDPDLHQKVEFADDVTTFAFDWAQYRPRYWMINGRVFPDTIAANNSASLPSQPYSALVRIQPASAGNPKPALVRMVSAGARTYPFHPHGNHDKVIGVDARRLWSTDGTQDLTRDEFSLVMVPGQTTDSLVSWADAQGFSVSNIGVPVPEQYGRINGAYWGGSPYLGQQTPAKPGETVFNECGEYYHVAHSHALYQVATYATSMSGMLTMTRIDPPGPNNCPAGG